MPRQAGPKLAKFTALPGPKTKRRECLGGVLPRHMFVSQGPGHRICPRCQQIIADRTRGLSPRTKPLRASAQANGMA